VTNEHTNLTDASAFQDYIGRSETTSGRIDGAPMQLLAALLDRQFDEMSPTGAVPPLWHWLILQNSAPQSDIGPDGHPKRGSFIPPIPYPRRMFAGARIQITAPLHVGEEVERTTTITSIAPKTGRSGKFFLVTLVHAIRGPHGLAVTEEQDLVFREGVEPQPTLPLARAPVDRGKPNGFSVVETIYPDPVLLFRYSAATGNTHRIHYDLDYVRNVEGYPNLIVHGPLQAIMLAELATRQLRRPLTRFDFRALKPIFVGAPFYRSARIENGKLLVQTLDVAHDVCVAARAE
jgi:3-methylfumaryl-CoA hydratase